jgi:heme-degrading monooxygenase HmoA
MILRVLRGRVHPHRHGEFNEEVVARLGALADQPGLRCASFARQLPSAVQEFVFVTEWDDMNAVYQWVGSDLEAPRLFRDREDMLLDYQIEHYEVVGAIAGGRVLEIADPGWPG